ncbi:hypothetical protein QNH14_07345 [Apirhabdus apintestini]|nr:hypothetical protein QNH14_07345 [Enterobacteriaceae bacterium CA-0114]
MSPFLSANPFLFIAHSRYATGRYPSLKYRNSLSLVSGVWCLVSGVWCLVSGVWCLVSGVWCLVSGVWCLVSGVWCLVSGVWTLRHAATICQ